MAWFYERGFDPESVDFVEHALDQAFCGVLGCAVRSQAWDAEGAGGGGEDEEAAGVLAFFAQGGLFSEVGQGELDDVQCAEEVRLELRAQVAGVLVFAGGYYAVA